MNLNGSEYFYVRNAQGDINALIDQSGTEVVNYTYDTWGKLLSVDGSLKDTVGQKNPYRYRGYRYDSETGLYYLQSRYYNPDWGRFMNADAIAGQVGELLGHNIFAYCKNNSSTMKDPSGFMCCMADDFGYGGDTFFNTKNGDTVYADDIDDVSTYDNRMIYKKQYSEKKNYSGKYATHEVKDVIVYKTKVRNRVEGTTTYKIEAIYGGSRSLNISSIYTKAIWVYSTVTVFKLGNRFKVLKFTTGPVGEIISLGTWAYDGFTFLYGECGVGDDETIYSFTE